MIRSILQVGDSSAGLCMGALVCDAISVRRGRLDRWETLTEEDAEEGGFTPLSDGTRIHYVTRGTAGDAVILIHGLMGSTDEWAHNIDALATRHHVWGIDLIGFGYSSRVTEPKYSVRYYARTVREFMDAHGIARASLVGHSLGGVVALQFAQDYPERVQRLILVAPAIFLLRRLRGLWLAAQVPYLPRAVLGVLLTSTSVRELAIRHALGNAAHLDLGAVAARQRASRVKGTLDAMLAMAASPHASDEPKGLDRIALPTLILWGDRDIVLPLRYAHRLARELQNAHLVILEGAGHILNEEYPGTVNPLMLDFLEGRDKPWIRPN